MFERVPVAKARKWTASDVRARDLRRLLPGPPTFPKAACLSKSGPAKSKVQKNAHTLELRLRFVWKQESGLPYLSNEAAQHVGTFFPEHPEPSKSNELPPCFYHLLSLA